MASIRKTVREAIDLRPTPIITGVQRKVNDGKPFERIGSPIQIC